MQTNFLCVQSQFVFHQILIKHNFRCIFFAMIATILLLESNWIDEVKDKEKILQVNLHHTKIKKVNTAGLWAAIEFEDFETCKVVAHNCIKNGLITDWFLFAQNCIRIAPPLITTNEELKLICEIVIKSVKEI